VRALTLALTGLCVGLLGCAPDPDDLRSPDAETRLRAVAWMTRDELRQHLPLLIELAERDPAPMVRAEALRELGWTRDPAVLPVLDAAAAEHPVEVMQSLVAYGGPEGCARAARIPLAPRGRAHRWRMMSPCADP
jgi:HEAT repeat protein